MSHLDVKMYGSMKIRVSSVLTRDNRKRKNGANNSKENWTPNIQIRNCMINVSILNLEHQCHIKTSGWKITYLVGFIVTNN